jgi:HPt (histidine-containing phosphotransfer) domain-containing protein
MAQLATTTFEREPNLPAAAIDRSQLARMTLGDRSLEREVLQLFDRQAALLLARMHDAEASVVAPLAHTLKGSAASVGASAVMAAAAALETASGAAERKVALDRLAAAIDEAGATIADLLRDP